MSVKLPTLAADPSALAIPSFALNKMRASYIAAIMEALGVPKAEVTPGDSLSLSQLLQSFSAAFVLADEVGEAARSDATSLHSVREAQVALASDIKRTLRELLSAIYKVTNTTAIIEKPAAVLLAVQSLWLGLKTISAARRVSEKAGMPVPPYPSLSLSVDSSQSDQLLSQLRRLLHDHSATPMPPSLRGDRLRAGMSTTTVSPAGSFPTIPSDPFASSFASVAVSFDSVSSPSPSRSVVLSPGPAPSYQPRTDRLQRQPGPGGRFPSQLKSLQDIEPRIRAGLESGNPLRLYCCESIISQSKEHFCRSPDTCKFFHACYFCVNARKQSRDCFHPVWSCSLNPRNQPSTASCSPSDRLGSKRNADGSNK